jgi:hypothetical protein
MAFVGTFKRSELEIVMESLESLAVAVKNERKETRRKRLSHSEKSKVEGDVATFHPSQREHKGECNNAHARSSA